MRGLIGLVGCLASLSVLWYATGKGVSYVESLAVASPAFSSELLPAVFLIGLLLFLGACLARGAAEPEAGLDRALRPDLAVVIGWLLFASYLVGTTEKWLLIPVPFLLALWVFWRVVLVPPERRIVLDQLAVRVRHEREGYLEQVLARPEAGRVRGAVDALWKKLFGGDLSATDLEKRRAEVSDLARRQEKDLHVAYGLSKQDVALGFGPYEANWENGLYGGARGLILALPPLLLVVLRRFGDGLWSYDPLLLLRPVQDTLIAAAQWYAAGFFFGYYFPYLRGESGLKKGLYLSLAVLLCHLPIWIGDLASPTERAALLFRASAIVIFYTGLGVWFFDYRSFRQALRDRCSWAKFLQFESTPGLTALGSVILGSVVTAVSSVATGQFQAILGILTRLVTSEPTPPTPR